MNAPIHIFASKRELALEAYPIPVRIGDRTYQLFVRAEVPSSKDQFPPAGKIADDEHYVGSIAQMPTKLWEFNGPPSEPTNDQAAKEIARLIELHRVSNWIGNAASIAVFAVALKLIFGL